MWLNICKIFQQKQHNSAQNI